MASKQPPNYLCRYTHVTGDRIESNKLSSPLETVPPDFCHLFPSTFSAPQSDRR